MLSSAYIHSESLLVILAGPTASGKSSICRGLIEKDPTLTMSISTTTRSPRKGEVEGKDYFFVTKKEFESRISSDAFIEYAKFGVNMYGTQKDQFEKELATDLLLDIEIQGVKQVINLYPERSVVIFVVPPSFQILEQRLRERATESEESIQRRLEIARGEFNELSSSDNSDYLLVNDDLASTIDEALKIIHSERRNISRIAPDTLQSFFE